MWHSMKRRTHALLQLNGAVKHFHSMQTDVEIKPPSRRFTEFLCAIKQTNAKHLLYLFWCFFSVFDCNARPQWRLCCRQMRSCGAHIMLSPISATYMVTGPTLFSSANEENVFGSAGAHKWEGPMSHEMTAGDAKVQQWWCSWYCVSDDDCIRFWLLTSELACWF